MIADLRGQLRADRQAYLTHALAVGEAEKFEPPDADQVIRDWLAALEADPADTTDARVQRRVDELLEGVA